VRPIPAEPFSTGLVLAAGGSRRLGQPKQLLPYNGATLLDHTVATARAAGFQQLIVVLGGAGDEVRARVDLSGTRIVENHVYGHGCSSSIAAALPAVDPRASVLVLMLGDQPGVTPQTVCTVVAASRRAPLAICRYEDGRGHPIAFARSMFGELAALHGDKGVWRLLDRHQANVVEVPISAPVPRDVDTWEDYQAILETVGRAP
jgi:molybdenum cofactor cytidylyltransferase